MKIIEISADNFITELSVSEEEFIHQFGKVIDAKKDKMIRFSDMNSSRFIGESISSRFKVKKLYTFGLRYICVVEGIGNITKKNNSISINTKLNPNKGFDSSSSAQTVVRVGIIVFITLLCILILTLSSLHSMTQLVYFIGILILTGVYDFWIRKYTFRRGVEKMKDDLQKEFELIELRAKNN